MAKRKQRLFKSFKGTTNLAACMLLKRPLPYSMTFILTNRCNYRCEYCNIPDNAHGEMSQEQFEQAIDQFAAAGMVRASFSGGEALIRPDAPAIIHHAHKLGLYTSLNTNGWMVDRLLDETADALDLVMVSLDGPQEVHDVVRKRKGAFEKAMESIRGARERGLTVTTITVLNQKNLHVVDDILELADKYGFWAYFQPAYIDCFEQTSGLDPALAGQALREISDHLLEQKVRDKRVGASAGYLDRLANNPDFGDCADCHAGRYFGTVMPDGTVVRCHLKSNSEPCQNGNEVGFVNAFRTLGKPSSGNGCAISPYQELDLIFGLDRSALKAALKRLEPQRLLQRGTAG